MNRDNRQQNAIRECKPDCQPMLDIFTQWDFSTWAVTHQPPGFLGQTAAALTLKADDVVFFCGDRCPSWSQLFFTSSCLHQPMNSWEKGGHGCLYFGSLMPAVPVAWYLPDSCERKCGGWCKWQICQHSIVKAKFAHTQKKTTTIYTPFSSVQLI